MDTLCAYQYTFLIISCSVLRMINIADESCRENWSMHVMFNTFFQKLCHLWDNVETLQSQQATGDNIVGHMGIACWIPKSTTHTQNMLYLLLFHCGSGYINMAQCYIYMYDVCVVWKYHCYGGCWQNCSAAAASNLNAKSFV